MLKTFATKKITRASKRIVMRVRFAALCGRESVKIFDSS
jgi:hypothetical protein